MKKPLLIFAILFILLEIVTPLGAINQPNVDDIELMLKKIENNLKSASQVTSLAKANGEKLVESTVQEKDELKQKISNLNHDVVCLISAFNNAKKTGRFEVIINLNQQNLYSLVEFKFYLTLQIISERSFEGGVLGREIV